MVRPSNWPCHHFDARAHASSLRLAHSQMVVVVAPQPPTSRWVLDGCLVAAHAEGLQALIVVNKADTMGLVEGGWVGAGPEGGSGAGGWPGSGGRGGSGSREGDEEAVVGPALSVYQSLGYPVVQVSATTGVGMDALVRLLEGRRSVLIGQSGVGKSSLLNRLRPASERAALARVGGLSDAGLGAHTTTHAELYHLRLEPEGAAAGPSRRRWADLIDCAGFRDFPLWHLPLRSVQRGFPEVDRLAARCRYRDCRHDGEPGCAVAAAAAAGEIDPTRLRHFRALYRVAAAV